jgi:hypothetical protein
LQSLSKKERKKMELEDLDGLLDEFGLGGGGSNEEAVDVKGIEEMETKGNVDNGDEGGGNGVGKKKKKKKKKPSAGSTAISMTESVEWVKVEPSDKVGEGVNDSEETTTVDVASVLKNKMALKAASNTKSASEIAADAAAKEAKAKAAKKAEADKKKLKKKNKVQIVCHAFTLIYVYTTHSNLPFINDNRTNIKDSADLCSDK